MDNRRTWVVAAVGAVVLTAAVVVAVVAGTQDDGGRDRDRPAATSSATPSASGAPTGTPAASATPDGSPSGGTGEGGVATPVYYVGDTPAGPRLFREFHRLPGDGSEAARVKAALAAAVQGDALDPDYRSAWPDGTTVAGVTVDGRQAGDVVWIDLAGDLHDRPAGMTGAEASMAVEQLLHTAHAVLQRRPPVQITIDGERTDTVLGVPTSEPLAAGDPMKVQGTVWVISPQDGDTVGTTFTVEGRGAFFEATVSWQLLQDGDVVKDGFATAEEGMTLSPFSFRVKAAPGDYVLRVYDADMSGGEGNGEMEDTKRITVR